MIPKTMHKPTGNFENKKNKFSEKAECAESICFIEQNTCRRGFSDAEGDRKIEKNPCKNRARKGHAKNLKKH